MRKSFLLRRGFGGHIPLLLASCWLASFAQAQSPTPAPAQKSAILIMGATNAPWHMDPAFRRPGRFDRIIFVPPPDQEGRKRILDLLLRGMPAEDIDTAAIAKVTEHFSGADLKAVIDTCVEDKLADAFTSGKPEPITTKDLKKAAGKLKPTTREWFNSAKNYALYANDGGLYDEILKYVK